MEEIQHLNYTPREIKTFNNFRIFFQVYTMAELTNAQGTEVLPKYRCKNLVRTFTSSSATLWPNQDPPDLQFYYIWLNGIKAICKCNEHGLIDKERVLGEWQVPPQKWILHNQYIHNNHRTVLVKSRMNRWKQYQAVNNNTIHIEYVIDEIFVWDQRNIQEYKPCDITWLNNRIRVKKRTLIQCRVHQERTENPIADNALIDLRTSIGKCINTKNTKFSTIPSIVEIQEEICICSDGGVKNNTPGVGIVTANGASIIATSKFKFDPEYNDIHSYRCEGIGLLGAVKMFQLIQIHYNSKVPGTVKRARILCDNQSVVKVVNKYRTLKRNKNFFYESESEIILEILQTIYEIEALQGQITIMHIKGHQDKQQLPLTFHGYMNQQADMLASLGMHMRSNGQIDSTHTKVVLLLNDKRVTSKHSSIMKENYHSIELREYMTDSNNWAPAVSNTTRKVTQQNEKR
jgi:ribonuclease HI